jgi:CRISPR-associated protein Cmr2
MYNLSDEIKYPSTSEMATVLYKKSLNEDFINNFISKLKKIFVNELPSTVSVPGLKNHPLYETDGQWLMESSYRKSYLKNEFGIDVDAKLNEMNEMREFLNKNKIKPPVYYAILAMDGDNIGKWLKGDFQPYIKDVIHHKMFGCLLGYTYSDRNIEKLLYTTHPMSPSIHNQFSRRLSEFALNRVQEIVEDKYYGKLIYAGGDDVLAFLPVEIVVDCAFDLNKAFRDMIGEKATMSAGIVIVHHKYPLSLALDEVREAEKLAKNRYGKDAFCIKYLSGSGQERFSGLKWDDKEKFFDKIIQKYKDDELSSRFAYDFMNLVKELISHGTTGDNSISELLKNELKRIHRHKLTKEKYDSEFEEILLTMLNNFSSNYEDFANLLIIARAIAKIN